MNAFVLQMTSTPSIDDNINFVINSLRESRPPANSLVVLPECFACFGGKDNLNLRFAEKIGTGDVQDKLSKIAKDFQIYLVAGSFPTHSANPDKFMASSLVFAPDGKLISDYQKIHLFDVVVADSTGSYRESDSTVPGNKLAVFDTSWGKVGLAICYDLRFPGLFQALRQLGADTIVLPSAFTERTGSAHWLPLLQARAIENQVYMVAANQNGVHQNGRETYGHSMVVSPWGKVLANAERNNGLFGAELDTNKMHEIRKNMPVFNHNKFQARLK
ncbi:carbon-nitrogen hydrolase family protein [Psychrosphaera aestuarii]|uniref:carbon-nitrogen hydrolase family protein n=1 Tax=Psychrosphaera aestuarii TaxID=1266052 RepID=UPI001B320840|nr:carbon-nitrogen hydrolase family protein [Psychrosphaera aestuarii]